jgi:hypothetical protein
MPGEDAVDLCSALETLRQDLEQAWVSGQGHRVSFRVSEVSLTLLVSARREKKANGRVRWWLADGGGEYSAARESTQTLVLTLAPQLRDDAGATESLIVADKTQLEPGQ